MIIPALNEIQDRLGYLPEPELRALAKRLRVPLHRVHEVASFYPRYRLKPPPPVRVQVCRDLACFLRGAAGLRANLEALARDAGGIRIAVEGVSCLGQCDRPPAVAVNDHVYRGLSEAELLSQVKRAAAGEPLPRQRAGRSPTGWRIDVDDGR